MNTARWFALLACLACSAEVTPSSPDTKPAATEPAKEEAAAATAAVNPAVGEANLKACKAWTEGVRALPCAGGALKDDQCPDAIKLTPNDLVAYYDCMASKYTCVDGALEVADVSVCNQHMTQ